jgi:hypothetical protein
VDGREFAEFDGHMRRQLTEFVSTLQQKAGIKDVCALLDMKSNIDDVNKALAETHEEIQQRVSLRDFQGAQLE